MRSLNAVRNMTVSTVAQIFNMFLSFAGRTIFVKLLATEYLGLSGLFTNILSVLSLSELGIGNAIIVNLYKPIAEKDEKTVCQYMNFYAKAYRVIGIVIMLFGVVSTPFLHYLVNTDVEIPNLQLIYFLFIANSSLSYFFTYKRTIFSVDQKEYINTINTNVFHCVLYVLQISVLLLTRQYILYVLMMPVCTVLSNLSITLLANRHYPFLKNKTEALSQERKKELIKTISALVIQKTGNVLVNSTDNIIISAFIGVYYVGLYSNYCLIVNIVTTFAIIASSACSASVGDLNAMESAEKVHGVFKAMSLISFWIYGFCSICFLCLFNPFISLWLGQQYLLSFATVCLIVLAFFLKGIIGVVGTFIDATKLFVNTRWVSIIMAVINLIVSIIGAKWLGLAGVFLGTVVSYMLTFLWVNPWILYKKRFNKPVREYVYFILARFITVLIAGGITLLLTMIVQNFLVKALVCLIVPNVIMLIMWRKTAEVKYLYEVLMKLFKLTNKRH